MNPFTIDHSFFDTVHNRKNTGCVKYDGKPPGYSSREIIPMWVADMDFKVPPQVEEALVAAARHGIFGYTTDSEAYDRTLTQWYRRRMGWEISPEWNWKIPGVMFAAAAAIQALTQPEDSVLIFQPVYYPFAKIVPGNKRRLVVSELVLKEGRYEMNFADLEKKIREQKVKIILLCSPHNPVGRVWTRQELTQLGELCIKYDLFVVSDEIHSDFIYEGHTHIPFATLSEELAERTITCISPSKTFNLAGLQAANAIISNPVIRRKIKHACLATGYSNLGTMSIAASISAYEYGEPWLETLLSYLKNNINILQEALSHLNGRISLVEPEGTYLMWLDCRNLHLSDRELNSLFLEKAGLWLHNGSTFGAGGSGFMRMNIACPKSILTEALERITEVLS